MCHILRHACHGHLVAIQNCITDWNCTHPRYSQRLADISSTMHTEPPWRSSVQNNLPRTHCVITAFKMVPPAGNRRQQRNTSWWSTGTRNSVQTRLTLQESRSYHDTEFLTGSTKSQNITTVPDEYWKHKWLYTRRKGYNHSSTLNLIPEGKISPENVIRFHLKATLRVRECFGVNNLGVELFKH